MKENEELYNEINNAIAKCDKCEDCEFYGDKGNCQNKRIAKALIGLGYHKIKPVIIKINDKVEIHCDTMEDYDEFLKEILKPIANEVAKDIVNAGYIQLKTNGDYIRKMYGKSDEELASEEIAIYTYDGKYEYSAKLVLTIFDTYEKAYEANLEWLKKEYKGE